MAIYTPPSRTAVDFDLKEYTAEAVNPDQLPISPDMDMALVAYTPQDWTPYFSPMTQALETYTPDLKTAVDHDLVSYTPPTWQIDEKHDLVTYTVPKIRNSLAPQELGDIPEGVLQRWQGPVPKIIW